MKTAHENVSQAVMRCRSWLAQAKRNHIILMLRRSDPLQVTGEDLISDQGALFAEEARIVLSLGLGCTDPSR